MAMRNGVIGAFVPDRYHKKLRAWESLLEER
jgi:hypothetical protein